MSTTERTDSTARTLAGGLDADLTRVPVQFQEGEIRARGYWEQVWLRLKRDKVAIASVVLPDRPHPDGVPGRMAR